MANSKAIGVAFSDQDIYGADSILSSGKLGYTTSALGLVTQLVSKATAVTLNKSSGRITTFATAMLTGTLATFTVNNSLVSVNDTVILSISGGATSQGYNVWVDVMAAGSFNITLLNRSAGTLTEAVIINFALLHCE
tara:strand:+ start:426 stop:836 length:411 start_codon:yes stop_codon:yes gene_type:complete